MPQSDPLLESLKGDRSGEAVNLAIDTFTPNPALETTPLRSAERSDYRAIGASLVIFGALGAFVMLAYGTKAGMPLAPAVLLAVLLLTGMFAFGFAFLTLRKLPFVLGLVALGVTMTGSAVVLVVGLATEWTAFGLIEPHSDYVSPVGLLLFSAIFGGGSFFMALRMARSSTPFYGFR